MATLSRVWPHFRAWVIITLSVLPVVVWLSYATGRPLLETVRDLPFGVLLSATIGGIAWVLVPFVGSVTRARGWRSLATWAALLAACAAAAVVGTGLAAVAPFLFGLIPARTILVVFRENIGGTVPMTLGVGVTLILLGAVNDVRLRLEATELSLKTQQLGRERAEKLAAEAQLASLSSRVQPHFLFNTLNSISGLIREQPAQAEAMIEHLSALLRSSLDGKEVVEIAQELKLVTDYLEIQRTRFGERLRYDLAVAPDAAGAVPPFSLQTLAENSVKHVAGRRAEGVALRIEARHEDNALVLDVTDDGPGFEPDAMKAGHGLDILQRRLRAIFGPAGMMEFRRSPQAMTVRLRVPVT